MAYGILRVKKIKSTAALSGALRHNTREKPPKNADPKLTKENFSSTTFKEAIAKFKQLLPEKRRKDATLAVEIVLTSSGGFFEDKKQASDYLLDGLNWLEKRFGGRENIIGVDVHRDEATDHLHYVFIPLKNGRLNAKGYLGGPADLRKLQDDFYKDVSKKYGLERGIPKDITKRTHTKPGEYPKAMERLKKYEEGLLARDKALQGILNEKTGSEKLAVEILENLHGSTEKERKIFWPEYHKRLPKFISGLLDEARQQLRPQQKTNTAAVIKTQRR